ncbi:Methyl-accepting chemotaxis protein [Thiothrix eikelboomii]|uniref:Methyl-accepting chemotaxis protein n=1 Tax=Thiothrix eikelboomii TaxID=92487 RepID=A0A1T4WFZ4_9GAMM|nr:methyl-accepting chemotaxis protein [Thiothrix eikelboomii]SKA76117.1 Methyl-accepting chemotaxis protein [Thiothrix eikelboomii]
MDNSTQLSNSFFTGKMIWIPIGLLLFSIMGMIILFVIGSAWLDYQQAMHIGMLGCFVMLLNVLWVTYLFYRFYTQQTAWSKVESEQQESIMCLLDEMSTLAEGDLTIRATVSENITGTIADSVNYAVDALRELVIKIDDTSGRLTRFAQIADKRITQLSQASTRQSEEISMASSAIAAMTHSIHKVSRNAAASTEVARKSLEISQAGAHTVRSAMADMVTVREQIQSTSKRIKRLGETSQEVGDIVRLMNDIAEQTNILALNASIQTSSIAGGGRSFERVTDEVQQLAQRSAEASRKIDLLVRAIQTDTQEAIASMEQTTARVVTSSRNADSAGAALDEVEEVSTSLARLIANISDASFKQADMATRVTSTMQSIQEGTLQTEQFSKETTELVSNLNETASELRRSIADFTLNKTAPIK